MTDHDSVRDGSETGHATGTRRSFLAAAGAGAAVGLAGCTGGGLGDGDDTVRVGALYPLSGPLGEVGQRIRTMLESAVDDIVNEEQPDLDPLVLSGDAGLPNLGGAEVEITFADHRADAGEGRAEAERMVQEEEVDLLYGAFNSAVSKTVSQVAEREGVPHVTGESSSPDLTDRGLEWFWRTGPHDGIFTLNMFQFFEGLNEREDAGLETVAIIHEDTEFGSVSARVQEDLIENEFTQFEIVEGPIAYTAEEVTSLSSEIQRIAEADPDVLLPTSYVRDALLIQEELRSADFFPPLIMAQNSGHNDPEFANQTELSQYVCSRSTFAADLTDSVPELSAYNQFVQERTDIAFNGIYIRSWGGLLCALKGVDNAGSTDPGAIQEGINDLTLDRIETGMPYGLEFQDDGQNGEASGVLVQLQDGASRLIWPFDLAPEDNLAFPAPGWDER
jgi:branched-chain amino acid transport system substrate-binding protein